MIDKVAVVTEICLISYKITNILKNMIYTYARCELRTTYAYVVNNRTPLFQRDQVLSTYRAATVMIM